MSTNPPDSDDPIDPTASDAVTSSGDGEAAADAGRVEARSRDRRAKGASTAADAAADSWPFLQAEGPASPPDVIGDAGDPAADDEVDVSLDAVLATGPDDPGEAPVATTRVESARAPSSASFSANEADGENAAVAPPESLESLETPRPTLFARIRSGMSPNAGSLRRAAVRSLLFGLAAMAVGFGYGASVRLFFGGHDRELSPISENSPTPSAAGARDAGSPSSGVEVAAAPSAPVAPAAAGALAASGETAAAARVEGHEPDTAPVSASHGAAAPEGPGGPDALNGEADPSSSALPKATFTMPTLRSALPRDQHPLAVARERLQRGDLEAARRVAASYLLREDALGHEDQLFVAQAYALLADSLRVEWERGIAAEKDESSRSKPESGAGAEVEDRKPGIPALEDRR